jgi:hypothetical protein
MKAAHKRVLYVSTEDDAADWNVRLQKPICTQEDVRKLDGLHTMFPEGKEVIKKHL